MRKNNLTDQVVEYLLKSTDDELSRLSVEKIAKHFDVSVSFLCRKFRNEKYFTIGKFIFKERMFRAAQLLSKDLDININIKALGEKMGFYDYDYFIRVFKNYYGISPSRYRECVHKKPGGRETFKIQEQ